MNMGKFRGTDDELIAAFEGAAFRPGEFGHADHVRLAYALRSRRGLMATLEALSTGLRNLATANEAPDLYHETLTWAFALLIHQRMLLQPAESWPQFAAANPDLLEWPSPALAAYYRPETLESDLARRSFVLPDRTPLRPATG